MLIVRINSIHITKNPLKRGKNISIFAKHISITENEKDQKSSLVVLLFLVPDRAIQFL